MANGPAPMAMRSAQMPWTKIPMRNPTLSIPFTTVLQKLACHPMSLEVDCTKGMAWPLMRFNKLTFSSYSSVSRPDECRVEYF